MNLREFLKAEPGEERTTFHLGEELHGAFGGAFGGVVAASLLFAARQRVPDRRPVAVDARFLRSLPRGDAEARVEVVRSGRSVTELSVVLTGSDGRQAASALVALADPEALQPREEPDPLAARRGPVDQAIRAVRYDAAIPLTSEQAHAAPVVASLAPRLARPAEGVFVSVVKVPWTPEPGTGAEAACLAADMCTGPPVVAGLGERWAPHPNGDLSVRFATDSWLPEVAGAARLEWFAAGCAVTHFDLVSEGRIVGAGVSTSYVLAPRRSSGDDRGVTGESGEVPSPPGGVGRSGRGPVRATGEPA